jgi:hypothetical protein
MADAPSSFDEYWSRYVRFHADERMRKLQFASTTVGLGVAATGLLLRRLSVVAAASAFAFAPSVFARLAWGKSSEPIQGSPLYRVAAAVKAWRMTVNGTLQAEIDRVSTPERPVEEPSREERLPRPNMVTDHTLH